MDNLCHTLVGAALAQSGLKRRSPLGTVTLLIGANLPDVDVISLAWGSTSGLACPTASWATSFVVIR